MQMVSACQVNNGVSFRRVSGPSSVHSKAPLVDAVGQLNGVFQGNSKEMRAL